VTDFLRKHVVGGEKFVTLVKKEVYRDKFLEEALPQVQSGSLAAPAESPAPAIRDATRASLAVAPPDLGIEIEAPTQSGEVQLQTWTAQDNALVTQISDARQNGVPLIEYDAIQHKSSPGAWVNRWGEGNWSGSANQDLRTVRAGLCLQEAHGRRYLLYGYFSDSTPSALARVFRRTAVVTRCSSI
jgi:hypothetical protein